DFLWTNLAQTQLGLPTGVAPDGRPIYSDLQALNVNNAIQLTNASGGRSHVISAALAKRYDNGFNFDVSYAFQDVNTVTPGTSSRGVSNFRSLVTFDRNGPEIGTAPFETRHAFNISLGYENKFFGDLTSRFDLFGTITSGEPFSYTFDVSSDNPLFGRQGDGESPFDNDLLYIPTVSGGMSTDSNVVFASTFDGAAFENYINDRGLPQGGIFNRNEDRSNWNQLWNFRFQQDLPFADLGIDRLEGNRMRFIVDIFNVANLINDKWGTQFDGPRFDTQGIVRADLVSTADVQANGVDGATALSGNEPATVCQNAGDCQYRFTSFRDQSSSFPDFAQSVYRIRVGLQYDF
ncbi:MAG: TonB-dependent receptor, partial [Hyphococcus sp.]